MEQLEERMERVENRLDRVEAALVRLAEAQARTWVTLNTHEQAQALGVDWKVGADLSPGFLAFRRLAVPDGEGRMGQKGQG